MEVTTKVVYDIDTFEVLYKESFEYDGPVALCKKKSKKADQAAQEQLALSRELVALFRQQFAAQEEIAKFLEGILKPLVESPTGFFEGEEAALRTSASEDITAQFENAQRAFQERAFILGGREVPGGALLAGDAALRAAQAAEEAGAQRAITLTGSQLRRQQLFSGAAILAGLRNPLALAGLAQSGLSSAGQLFINNKQPSLLGQVLGGILGGVSGFFTGGFSSLVGGGASAGGGQTS